MLIKIVCRRVLVIMGILMFLKAQKYTSAWYLWTTSLTCLSTSELAMTLCLAFMWQLRNYQIMILKKITKTVSA